MKKLDSLYSKKLLTLIFVFTFLIFSTLPAVAIDIEDEEENGLSITSVQLKDNRTLYGYKNSDVIVNFPEKGDKITAENNKVYTYTESDDIGGYFAPSSGNDGFFADSLDEYLDQTGSYDYIFTYSENVYSEEYDYEPSYYAFNVEVRKNEYIKSIEFPDYQNKKVTIVDGIDMDDFGNHKYDISYKFPEQSTTLIITLKNGASVEYGFDAKEEDAFLATALPSNARDVLSHEIDLYDFDFVYNDDDWEPNNEYTFKVAYQGIESSPIKVEILPSPIIITFVPANNNYTVNASEIKDETGKLDLHLRGEDDFFKIGDKINIQYGASDLENETYIFQEYIEDDETFAGFLNDDDEMISVEALLQGETEDDEEDNGITVIGRNEITIVADGIGAGWQTCYTKVYMNVVQPNTHIHTLQRVIAKEPTCEKRGYESYYKCSSCNALFADRYEQQPLDQIPYIDPIGHDYGKWEVIKEATCKEEGIKQKVCANDNSHIQTESIPKTNNHNWGGWVIAKEATEDEEGISKRICLVCNEEETKSIPKLEHTHKNGTPVKENEKKATCEQEGYYDEVVYCSKCGEELSRTHKTTNPKGHAYGDWTIVKEATCKEEGLKQKVCANDNSHKITESIPKTNEHIWGEWSITKEATEDEEGIKKRSCLVCGKEETGTISKLTHTHKNGTPVKENEKKATCEQEGYYDEVVYCSKCGEELSRTHKTTNPKGHAYGDWTIVKEATCKEEGLKQKVCANDNSHKITESIPKTNEHIWGEWSITKEATEDEEGIKKRSCSVCGKEETGTISKLTHTHKKGTPVKENEKKATCEQGGHYDEVVYCSKCGEELSRTHKTTNPKGHAYSEWTVVKESTCKEEGLKQKVCANDNSHKITESIPKTNNHQWGDWEIVTEPTNFKEGLKKRHCTVCNKEETETIPASGGGVHVSDSDLCDHELGTPVRENEIPATCEQGGSYTLVTYCTKCNKSVSTTDVTTDPLGHKWSEWTTTKEATEKEEGIKERHCTTCQKKETSKIPKVQHIHSSGDSVIENEHPATCEQGGSYDTVVYCKQCGAELSRKTVNTNPKGHAYGEWEITKSASCNEEGSKQKVCANDNSHIITETIPKTNIHNWSEWTTTKEATEDEEGLKERHCSTCGKEETSTISKKDHAHVNSAPTKENVIAATCEQNGSYDEVIYCSKCKEEISRITKITEPKGHAYSEWTIIQEATCKDEGLKEKVCTNDNSHKITESIPKTDKHNWSDWKVTKEPTDEEAGIRERECSVCKKIETEEISQTAHVHVVFSTEKETIKEATCTKKGSYKEIAKCACGEIMSETEKESNALGHDWGKWTNKDGQEIRECQRCHKTETKTESFQDSQHVHNLTLVKEVPATDTETGTKQHYICECGKKFLDEKGTKEVSDSDLIIPKVIPDYSIKTDDENNNIVWTQGSDEPLVIRFSRNVNDEQTFEKFKGVLVDGKETNEYEARKGSVIITFNKEFVEKLSTGKHTVTALFEDGQAEATFTIAEANTDTNQVNSTQTNTNQTTDNNPTNVSNNKTETTKDSNASVETKKSTEDEQTVNDTDTTKDKKAKTGDNSLLYIWLSIFIFVLGLGMITIGMKKIYR